MNEEKFHLDDTELTGQKEKDKNDPGKTKRQARWKKALLAFSRTFAVTAAFGSMAAGFVESLQKANIQESVDTTRSIHIGLENSESFEVNGAEPVSAEQAANIFQELSRELDAAFGGFLYDAYFDQINFANILADELEETSSLDELLENNSFDHYSVFLPEANRVMGDQARHYQLTPASAELFQFLLDYFHPATGEQVRSDVASGARENKYSAQAVQQLISELRAQGAVMEGLIQQDYNNFVAEHQGNIDTYSATIMALQSRLAKSNSDLENRLDAEGGFSGFRPEFSQAYSRITLFSTLLNNSVFPRAGAGYDSIHNFIYDMTGRNFPITDGIGPPEYTTINTFLQVIEVEIGRIERENQQNRLPLHTDEILFYVSFLATVIEMLVLAMEVKKGRTFHFRRRGGNRQQAPDMMNRPQRREALTVAESLRRRLQKQMDKRNKSQQPKPALTRATPVDNIPDSQDAHYQAAVQKLAEMETNDSEPIKLGELARMKLELEEPEEQQQNQ